MIILRQRTYAKKDYEGLDYLAKKDLKRERKKIARDLLMAKKETNKHYVSKKYDTRPSSYSLRTLFTNPEKVKMRNEISGNKENRDAWLDKARRYASERASKARKNALSDTMQRRNYEKNREHFDDIFGIPLKLQ